ncbi:MAG: NF038122 family metalloprotease [Proteobacteria bacterium]|nr:NF038122 family metalloprotease [Pseudomonadota bacterium]
MVPKAYKTGSGLLDFSWFSTDDATMAAPFWVGAETALRHGVVPSAILAVGDRIGGGTGGTASAKVTTVTTAGSGLTVNLLWDSSVTSLAPSLMAAFQTDVINAVKFLEATIVSSVTVNLRVGYGEVGGSNLSRGALGESISNLTSVSYSDLVAALHSVASSDATDTSMLASLPATPPTSDTYWVTTAQAKALGLAPANSQTLDGAIGFGLSTNFTYGDTNTTGTVAPGTYDFFSTVAHEVTETMGRMLLVGGSVNGAPAYTVLDLAHYSAPGVMDFTQTTPGYFSIDGGVTNLGDFNTIRGGDAGDWASTVTNDSFDAFGSPGSFENVSANDFAVMDAIGWTLAGTTAAPPAGVTISPATASVGALQSPRGLTANTAIATFAQQGGHAGDTFIYTLGGANAGSFSLDAATGVLSTGSAVVAGAANGQAYALTVTATDTTAGASAPAQAVNVVVGNGSGNRVSVASLVGSGATATPTFVYGLAGSDTLNGQGMTGPLLFAAGGGADTLTGGSGPNEYMYGAVTDSRGAAFDTITNFNVAMDTIDLTGIGASGLSFAGALASGATTIGADQIAYQQTGGGAGTVTSLYVNTSGAAEALGSANMKIALTGAIGLTSTNVLHA